jgi:hypothetical protein
VCHYISSYTDGKYLQNVIDVGVKEVSSTKLTDLLSFGLAFWLIFVVLICAASFKAYNPSQGGPAFCRVI